jgi:hypothetical protein
MTSQVTSWTTSADLQWTHTSGRGMVTSDFGDSLMSALTEPPPRRSSGVAHDVDAGLLRIHDLVLPPGFSGGGLYIRISPNALNPHATPGAPGDLQCSMPANSVECVIAPLSGKPSDT